jgi:hypothetical protein
VSLPSRELILAPLKPPLWCKDLAVVSARNQEEGRIFHGFEKRSFLVIDLWIRWEIPMSWIDKKTKNNKKQNFAVLEESEMRRVSLALWTLY